MILGFERLVMVLNRMTLGCERSMMVLNRLMLGFERLIMLLNRMMLGYEQLIMVLYRFPGIGGYNPKRLHALEWCGYLLIETILLEIDKGEGFSMIGRKIERVGSWSKIYL
ncbi:hypothetical protein CEXT_713271 [Caerostris extrusa]|uniref:Uncharacterized protein n=1 Tax=Caerostris extrusa TaxID=172846 RepID=A0AAV4QPN8_CAEEX|nr:hypothetical protein CEXT_713271 [Caerostris extrusa]